MHEKKGKNFKKPRIGNPLITGLMNLCERIDVETSTEFACSAYYICKNEKVKVQRSEQEQ
jgi:hypothetical protein